MIQITTMRDSQRIYIAVEDGVKIGSLSLFTGPRGDHYVNVSAFDGEGSAMANGLVLGKDDTTERRELAQRLRSMADRIDGKEVN
jgi:hypothetical protein